MNTFQNAGEIATKALDRWAWYQAALANPAEIGKSLVVHPSDPQQGYFRTRRKDGPWEPVAIFYPEDSDTLVAYRNEREVQPDDVWAWCCRYPITYEAYERAMSGGGWADDDPTVAAQIGAGHNSGDVDEAEQIRDQIAAAKQGADAYQEITDDDTLAKAQSLRSRLNELAREADKIREERKRPHLDAGKAIDKEWQPIIKDAKGAADAIRSAMGAYETEKLRKQREAERKAEEERRKAEAADAPATLPEPPAPAPAPAPIKGNYGKAASVSVKVIVKDVTDWDALAAYMSGHPELQELLRKLAQRALNAGRMDIPGITTEEEANVR